MQSGIYKITNPKGRVYIGQSINLDKRLIDYKRYLKTGSQIKLKNSIIKYGVKNHIFEILEICPILLLNERERHWQEYYDVLSVKGLNCKYTKTLDKSGKLSQETRDKISISLKGSKRTLEQKENISKSHIGIKQSQSTIDKRVEKLKILLLNKDYRDSFGVQFKKKVY
jgi:group I intron endonuclease